MFYPKIQTVEQLLQDYDLVPVFFEVLGDMYTPIQIFHKLQATQENCFILESVDQKNQWGRYSFIGINPKLEIKIAQGQAIIKSEREQETVGITNIKEFLKTQMQKYQAPIFPEKPKLTGGFVGYFAYDSVRYIEERLVNIPEDELQMPDCQLFLYDELIAFDHFTNKMVFIMNIYKNKDSIAAQYKAVQTKVSALIAQLEKEEIKLVGVKNSKPLTVKANYTTDEYYQLINQAKEHIIAGDIFQVVLSKRFTIDNPPDSFAVYRQLRMSNPSPYLYYFKNPEYAIVGASPEMLVNVTQSVITTKPIAGTVPRGKDKQDDLRLEEKLLNDPKERAEHTMLVDLGRNDVGRVAKFGTVEVTDFMKVERYSKVMHLVSDVKGILQEGLTAVDALFAALPAGTLSGAPKVRAMEIIDALENRKRCLYGGTIGYLGFDGNMDTCIAIRTLLYKNGKAYAQAGGGIVAESVPETENEEVENKVRAILEAVKRAAQVKGGHNNDLDN